MALTVREYTDAYLKALWENIKKSRAKGKSGGKDWEKEIEDEMKRRGFPL